MLESLITPWRIKWYPACVLFALLVGYTIYVFSGEGVLATEGRMGGDFPAFYGAGSIVAKGDLDNIYNAKRQAAEQKNYFIKPSEYLPFSYPPYVALAFAPFGMLPYRIAYLIYTFLMFSTLLTTVHLLRRANDQIDRYFLFTVTILIWSFPIMGAVFLGQNTCISLLLIVLCWRAVLVDRPWLAGFFIGLLLYKPQFAIPLIGLFFLSCRWKVVAGSLITGTILLCIGLLLNGPDGYVQWVEFTSTFTTINAMSNSHNAISFIGFSQGIFGLENMMGFITGSFFTVAAIIIISLIWWKGGKNGDITAQMGLACAFLPMIPPHVMFYDIGLQVFTYAIIFSASFKHKTSALIILWLYPWLHYSADQIGFSPFFFLGLFTLVLSLFILGPKAVHGHAERQLADT